MARDSLTTAGDLNQVWLVYSQRESLTISGVFHRLGGEFASA